MLTYPASLRALFHTVLCAEANKNLEESFVMLAGSASSLRHAPAHASSSGAHLQPLDSKFAQMARVFEIASEATKAGRMVQRPAKA